GRRIGLRRLKQEVDGAGGGVVEGAVFALLGLLIAFTFSGAAARFDDRRNLIVDEANAVGTAYLRIDLLPAAAQGEMRNLFRRYLDARLAVYRALPDLEAAREHLASSNRIQQEIWVRAVAESADSQSARMLLLPALNEMFDITTKRTMAAQAHPPDVVFGLLFVFALCAALLAGSAMAWPESRRWLHSATFAFALAGSVYVIIDMEFPRVGLIRVDSFDKVLVEVRRSME
ncbi:MAG: DUF4239 domain-containing protein, partial [Burkholderiaceae bacterium]|nr:DUF4239 domain-containing protein [Burkholderiaceae bacterium]